MLNHFLLIQYYIHVYRCICTIYNVINLASLLIIMIHFASNDIVPNSRFHPYTCAHSHAYTTTPHHIHAVLFRSDHSSHSVQTPSPCLDPRPAPGRLRATRRSRVLHLRSWCSPPSLWRPDAHCPQPGTLQLYRGPDIWREASVWRHLPELQVSHSDARFNWLSMYSRPTILSHYCS